MDTIGSLIDKLNTVDLKLWNKQEKVYQIRKMTFEEFLEKYFKNEEGAKEFWEALNSATDLNVQRSQLIYEIDQKIVELVEKILSGNTAENFIQNPHKTY